MTLPSLRDPTVGVLSAPPRHEMIAARLREVGIVPLRLQPEDLGGLQRMDAVLLDCARTGQHALPPMVGEDDPLLVLFGADRPPETPGTIALRDLASLSWLSTHIAVRRRARVRTSEHRLRQMARELFRPSEGGTLGTHGHVLVAGPPSPVFLALQAALRRSGARISAALSTASFESILAEGGITHTIIDLDSCTAAFTAFLQRSANDPRLDTVSLFLIPGSGFTGGMAAIGHRADGLLDRDAAPEAWARQCLREGARKLVPVSHERSWVRDPLTALPSLAAFTDHLRRQIDMARSETRPHALVALRLSGEAHGNTPGIEALAQSLTRLIRWEDLATRADWRTVLLSLPDVDFRTASRAAKRLVRALALCGIAPDTVSWRAVEARAVHSATDLISAVMNGPFDRAVAA